MAASWLPGAVAALAAARHSLSGTSSSLNFCGSGLCPEKGDGANGDRRLDIVTTSSFNNSIGLLVAHGGVSFNPAVNIALSGSEVTALVGTDFNGDDLPDIVTANALSSNLSVLARSCQ